MPSLFDEVRFKDTGNEAKVSYGSTKQSASPLGNGAQSRRILQTYFQIYPSNLLDRGRVYTYTLYIYIPPPSSPWSHKRPKSGQRNWPKHSRGVAKIKKMLPMLRKKHIFFCFLCSVRMRFSIFCTPLQR